MLWHLIIQGPRAGIMVDGFRLDAEVVQNGHVCVRVVPEWGFLGMPWRY